MGRLRVGAGWVLMLSGVVASGCGPGSQPQQPSPSRQVDTGYDRSPYVGRAVEHPEELSGVWEAPDGRGGAVGLQLTLLTTIPADKKVLAGTVQSWTTLQVGVYERSGPAVQFGEERWLSDSPRGGRVRYEADRLWGSVQGIDLDLRRGPGDVWSGRFHREGFDGPVNLRRPEMTPDRGAQWYLGTWTNGHRIFSRRLHIGRGVGGALVVWSDALQALGSARYGPQMKPLKTATEIYGSLEKAHAGTDGEVTIEFGTEGAMCCPLVVEGSRGQHGTLRTQWSSQPQHVAGEDLWRRIAGASCVSDPRSAKGR